MQISKIRISNILGIDELDFDPGKFVEITGRNGSGKTSIIEAIKSVLKGGNDATLLRNGADSGEVVLILDEGIQLVKRVNGTKTDINIYDNKGSIIPKPQSYINNLIDMLSVNPVTFLTADKKQRTSSLLDVLHLDTPKEEIQKIIDDTDITGLKEIGLNGHALEVINNVSKCIYDERTAVNRAYKEKQGSVAQLNETLVEVDYSVESIESQIKELELKKEEFTKKKIEYIEQVNKNKSDSLEKARIEFEKVTSEINEGASQQLAVLNDKFNSLYTPIIEELSQLREQQKQSGAILKTKELINQYTQEALKLSKDSAHCTSAIESLESLKLSLLSKLPISGLEIKDGEIFRNGVIFDRLNTAQQVEIAIEVAKLRAGELKVVCVDGLEKLDTDTFNQFKEQSIASKLQMFVTKVSDNELTINN